MAYRKGGFNMSYNSNWSAKRVVVRVVATTILLWIAGVIMQQVAEVINNTHTPFWKGLSLVGFTVGSYDGIAWDQCGTHSAVLGDYNATWSSCVQDFSGTGILAVVGIIAVASIALEFVNISF